MDRRPLQCLAKSQPRYSGCDLLLLFLFKSLHLLAPVLAHSNAFSNLHARETGPDWLWCCAFLHLVRSSWNISSCSYRLADTSAFACVTASSISKLIVESMYSCAKSCQEAQEGDDEERKKALEDQVVERIEKLRLLVLSVFVLRFLLVWPLFVSCFVQIVQITLLPSLSLSIPPALSIFPIFPSCLICDKTHINADMRSESNLEMCRNKG